MATNGYIYFRAIIKFECSVCLAEKIGMEIMEKNLNQKEKTPSDAEIKKWKELAAKKYYKYERYSDVFQIDNENNEVLLSNFRNELKEIQDEIKKSIDGDASVPEYCNRTAILGLKPEYLTVEEAKIWEKFKLVKSFEDLRYFESLVFTSYKKRVGEEVYREIEPKIKEVLSNPDSEAKILIEKIRKNFQDFEKWRDPRILKDVSEDEFIERNLRKDIFYRHPRADFAWDLMGNRLQDRALTLKVQQNLDKLKEKGYEI